MSPDFFTGNRARLRGQLDPDSFVALAAFTQAQRGNDFAHTFEQESNFWYLTGINAPDWLLIIDVKAADEWLVAPTTTSYQALFEGSLQAESAAKTSGVQNILSRKEGIAKLRKLVAERAKAYTLGTIPTRMYGFVPNVAQRSLNRLLKGAQITDVRRMLARMRAIKQPAELVAMQRAIDVTIEGMKAVLAEARSYTHDYQADAKLTYEFKRRGHDHAFAPILSSGKNNCVLHYATSGARYHKNDWLLMDVGAKVDGYSADITRTVPLGQTTERQVAVYEAVKAVNDIAIDMLRPGQDVRDYLKRVDDAMAAQLQHLGLLHGKPTFKKVRAYFPHAIGHGLGIDPHDPLGQPEQFAKNMVLTVEAGIYIPHEEFGVRIEDDILLTTDCPKNLSAKLPNALKLLHKMVY